MPLQTQPAAAPPLVSERENPIQRSGKTVSFQTPGGGGGGGGVQKKSKTTGRRAFGDISNRKQQQPQPSQSTAKTEVVKPFSQPQQQSKATPSIRSERKPAAATPRVQAASSASTKSTQKVKRRVYYEDDIEVPYGPTQGELDELHDHDDQDVSVCSMEEEGVLFTPRDVQELLRQGMRERRGQEEEFLASTRNALHRENAALARGDEEYVKSTMVINVDDDDNDSIMDALNDLSLALSDDEEDDLMNLSIPL